MNERKLTQTDVAELAHVKQNSVSHWLRTDTLPNLKYVELLAKAFGLTVSELLGDYSGELSETDRQLMDLPKTRKEFLLKIHSLVEDEIKRSIK